MDIASVENRSPAFSGAFGPNRAYQPLVARLWQSGYQGVPHMRLRNACSMSNTSLIGLAVGAAMGLVAGLLAAPMKGSAMRALLRDRGLSLIEEGRRALRTSVTEPEPLTATLGEIASIHDGAQPSSLGATS